MPNEINEDEKLMNEYYQALCYFPSLDFSFEDLEWILHNAE